MDIFTLVGTMTLKGQEKVQQQLKGTEETAKKVSQGLKVVGAAFTAVGVAGLAMIQSTKKINAQLGVTALNLGVTTKEMRDLTLATTNVTFPIDEVTKTFDLLARAGVKDTEVMQAVATAFDTLGDATGRSASQVTAIMVPAMKTFNLTATEMAGKTDMMTYMSRKSTMEMEDFNTMVGYTTPELVKAGLTMEELTAILIHMEKKGYEPGRVMTREFMKATTLATKEQIPLYEAIGMTSEELAGYKTDLEGATGMTQEYADLANEQYTIMAKLKSEWEKLTLRMSGFLEPLEPILALMTALGPLMIGLSMVGIPTLIKAAKALGHTLKTLLLNPIMLLIAALGALGYATYSLIQQDIHSNKIKEAAAKVAEEQAKSEGKLTKELLEAQKALNELMLAHGKLTPERREEIEGSQELIALWEDGTYVLNEQTGALESGTAASEKWNEVMEAAKRLNSELEISEGRVTEGVKGAASAYIELREAYGLLTPEQEAYIEHLRELTKETDKAIDKQMELLRLLERKKPRGMTMKELKVLGEMRWAAERGITEVGGYAPGTTGFMRALGYEEYQHGGLIPEPTWLTKVGQSIPYGIMAERRPEYITPGGGFKTANIIIELDGETIAQVVKMKLTDEIRLQGGL